MANKDNRGKHFGKYTKFQKHKINPEKSKNGKNVHCHEPEEEGLDGRNSESIVIAEIRVSDNRRRDIDGMVATILDCLVGANVLKDDCIGQVDSIVAHASRVGKSDTGFRIVLIEKLE
jgi:Holliday junction resolvase RusA-like endonuclease